LFCPGVVGELCGLAFWRRQDSSVQNDADVASAETIESFGSLSGHEGKEQTIKRKHSNNKDKQQTQFFCHVLMTCLSLMMHAVCLTFCLPACLMLNA